jgi:carbamoyl-phosphate synthase large subunit
MKSTGEVMGTARSFGKAYLKAQSATGKGIPTGGTVIVDLETLGAMSQANEDITDVRADAERHFDVYAKDEFDDLAGALRGGEIDVIFSRDREILEVAVEEGLTYFSTVPSSRAALEALETVEEPLDVMALSERPIERRNWGE